MQCRRSRVEGEIIFATTEVGTGFGAGTNLDAALVSVMEFVEKPV